MEPSRAESWDAGTQIVLREVWQGRLWSVRPVTVVQDTPDLIALHVAPGTRYRRPCRTDGTALRLPTESWGLAEATWPWSTLRLHTPGASHEVWAAFGEEHQGLEFWYVNLQEPLRRTRLGFDYMDHTLDIIIDADLSGWHWKDEDEFDEAQSLGIISREQADDIRREGERVIERALKREGLFTSDWRYWSPPPTWRVPTIVGAWEVTDREVGEKLVD